MSEVVELASFTALIYLRLCLLVLGLASVLEYWVGDFPSAGLGEEIGFCRLILAWVRLISD